MSGGQSLGETTGWAWLFLVLLVVGIVLLLMAVVRGMQGGRTTPPRTGRSRAREVLDERCARDEVNNDDYRDDLQQTGDRT